MTSSTEKNTATFIHLSSLLQYIIPFGNYIFPIVIWSAKKEESEFVDYNGKQVLNFQLSIFTYTIITCLIAIPIFFYSIFKESTNHSFSFDSSFVFHSFSFYHFSGIAIIGISVLFLFIFLKIIEFILIIHAAVKTSNGEYYKYPMSIPFFK